MLANHAHDPIDEFIPAVIAESSQCCGPAQMIVAVRVTAGTAQRTLLGDLDGHHRCAAGQDRLPRCKEVGDSQSGLALAGFHGSLLSNFEKLCGDRSFEPNLSPKRRDVSFLRNGFPRELETRDFPTKSDSWSALADQQIKAQVRESTSTTANDGFTPERRPKLERAG